MIAVYLSSRATKSAVMPYDSYYTCLAGIVIPITPLPRVDAWYGPRNAMLEVGLAALVETTIKCVLDRRLHGEGERAQDFERHI